MVLRFISGRAGSGKSKLCLQEIAARLREDPQGFPLIYIVPEQATFQAEYALITVPGLEATMRAQVLSFQRLAWRIMQEVGGGRRLFIDDTGKGMLLQKLIEKLKGKLKIFKHAGEKTGSLESLVQLYNELKRARVPVSQLKGVFKEKDREEKGLPFLLFQEKLSDLVLLLEEMEKELESYYIDAEDYLALLADNISRSVFLKEAEIWVDGFYSFTNQEQLVLQELLKHCRRVSVTVCLGQDCLAAEKVEELNPFYPVAISCQKLNDAAARNGLVVEKVILDPETLPRFIGSPALGHLEKYLHNYSAKPWEGSPAGLRLLSAPNRRAEVEGLAQEIIRLVRDKNCRWRDIAILTGALEQYQDLFKMIFTDYEIPFFLDQERPVLHHPLVEFIRSMLEVVNENWRYEALFRCIKTEFPFPLVQSEARRRKWRERADRLENYVLAFGIHGYRWLQEKDWEYREWERGDPEKRGSPEDNYRPGEKAYLKLINATRRKISKPLLQFQKKFKAAITVREKTVALFELLQDLAVGERLEFWKKEALEKGRPEKARENEQVYNGLLVLLDQLVEIMGDEQVSAASYARILEAGLANLRLSLVPPALDQVLLGTVSRTRLSRIKFAFLPGVNDGILPSRPLGDGVFSENEREALLSRGLDIPPGSRRRLLDEQFMTYMALTRASQGLWISYSLADEEGRGLTPSLLIGRLKELFPALQEEALPHGPVLKNAAGCSMVTGLDAPHGGAAPGGAGQIFSSIVHPRKTLSHLVVQLGRYKKGDELHPLWWTIYNWYAAGTGWRELAKSLLGGVFYQNFENQLKEETSLQLYQKRMRASVTRLERYRACPFSHYLTHGLYLKERRAYRLDAPDIGRFFHAALRNVTLALQKKGVDWAELSKEECRELVIAEVELLIPLLQKEILLSSNRYRYLAEKLKDTVGRAVIYLGEQARRSRFRPVGVEVPFGFGPDSALPPICFTLENGTEVELCGRIDRIDLARDEQGRAHITIIDYKSGDADLNLFEVYHGLSLQILTYLDVVLTHSSLWIGKEVLPAGVFYFRIHAPFISSNVILPPEKIEQEMLRRYRMKGRVIADPGIVYLLDGQLQGQSGYSEIIPVGLTAQKKFYKNSAILAPEHFKLLRKHIRELIQKTAEEITSGCVAIRPYRLGREKACRYCPYTAVCQFDPLVDGSSFRTLKAEQEERIWLYLEPAENKDDREGGGGYGQ